MPSLVKKMSNRMLKHWLLIGIVPLLRPAPTHADTVDCSQAVAQQEVNDCARQSATDAEAALHKVLDSRMESLSDGDWLLAKHEQQKWQQWRNAACDKEAREELELSATNSAPALDPQLFYGCIQRKALARTGRIAAFHAEVSPMTGIGLVCRGPSPPFDWDPGQMPPLKFRDEIFSCAEIVQEIEWLDELDKDFIFRFAQQDTLEKLTARKTKTAVARRYDQFISLEKLEHLRRLLAVTQKRRSR